MDKELVLERTIFCTIASFEYKPMVELLVESFFNFHPKNKFIIFSSDLYDLSSLNESDNLEWRHLNIEGASESKRLSYSKIKPLDFENLNGRRLAIDNLFGSRFFSYEFVR